MLTQHLCYKLSLINWRFQINFLIKFFIKVLNLTKCEKHPVKYFFKRRKNPKSKFICQHTIRDNIHHDCLKLWDKKM